jgi:NAD(P)-dependent dehydrogenase (short-subunit alcohol dehydrogenase family)
LSRIKELEFVTTTAKGKTILLTGGASGIGAAAARLAVERGHQVLIGDIDFEGAKLVAQSIGTGASAISLDITQADQWARALDEAWKLFGRLDVLLNNAAVAYAGYATKVPLSDHERTVAVNFLGPMKGMLATLPRFLNQSSGHFVTVCSMTAFLPFPGLSSYAAAKHALRAFHHALALEQRDSPLKFTIVHPTSTETPMLEKEAQRGLALAFAGPSMSAEEAARIILEAMEKQAIEICIPPERGEVVRRVGSDPQALREMVIRGEAVGAEHLRARLAAEER